MILPAGRSNHLIVEMANCGADEVFRDGDRAPRASIVVFEKSSDWQCSVQASRCYTRYFFWATRTEAPPVGRKFVAVLFSGKGFVIDYCR